MTAQTRLQSDFVSVQQKTATYFEDCFYTGAESGCGVMGGLAREAKEKGDLMLTDTFREIASGVKLFGASELSSIGRLDSKFHPLTDADGQRLQRALIEIHKNWQAYHKFKQLVSARAEARGVAAELLPELKKMSVRMSLFHQGFLHAYFPDLIHDSLTRPMATAHKSLESVPDDEQRADTLRSFSNQLECLASVPVGPAFDRKYILPKRTGY